MIFSLVITFSRAASTVPLHDENNVGLCFCSLVFL